jgi:hypothetical protein
MISNETTIHYEIKGLRFGKHGEDNISVAIVRGDAIVNGEMSRFELILLPISDGLWKLVNLGWHTDGFVTLTFSVRRSFNGGLDQVALAI